MPTEDEYPTGALKQNRATKAVAVRTIGGVLKPWAVMTVDNGGHFATHADVESWVDIPGTPVDDE